MNSERGPLVAPLPLAAREPGKGAVRQLTHPAVLASTAQGLLPTLTATSDGVSLKPLPVMLSRVPPAKLPAGGLMLETSSGMLRVEELEKPSGEARRRKLYRPAGRPGSTQPACSR
jgi:hypothetical protein